MTNKLLHPLKSAADRISARTRIVIGQVLLLIGVLLLATALGIVPNQRETVLAGRSRLCEAVAVECSAQVGRGEIKQISGVLEPMLRRDENVISAALRRADGRIIAQFGNDPQGATMYASAAPADSAMLVPIWSNDRKWGSLEVYFKPISSGGLLGLLTHPAVRLIVFVSILCLALYLFYLRKMLQHLDPSKVVPPRVRSALDTLAEGLIVLDNEQRVVLANRSFAGIVGREPDELMGMHVSHLPWEPARDSASEQASPWLAVTGEGEGVRGVMMRLRDHRGAVRTFCVNCSPVLGGEGKTRGVLVSLDDVTQLEHNEAELRKSKEEAEHANRAKSEFLARMSHEIRTPMNAILGFADILRRGYEENEAERQEYLETIHSSGQHLLELINDILDLSKIESGRLEIETSRCSPNTLIGEVVSVLSVRAAQKGIGLEFSWDGAAPQSIQTDPTRLRQALTNLVGNAVKFTEAGGIRVIARLVADKTAPKLAIDVIDSGIGIDPHSLERIFHPFAQADTSITRRFGGTGLGLSISRQIAEALGGAIAVRSEVGKGTTFTLTVAIGPMTGIDVLDPARLDSTTSSTSRGPQRPDATLTGVRVLVADDGESNRKLVSLVLHRAGAVIESARDGREACEMAGRNRYDVILMDMQMPVMDGYTAAATLRRNGIKVPIIALTAHAMRGDEEKCRAAGCSAFLTKPIDMDLLIRTVAEAAGLHESGSNKECSPAIVNCAGPSLQSTLPTDDPEFCQIVEEFIERLRTQVGAIGDAWSKGDLDELASLAHWVKGSGGTAGFPALTAPAKQLEQAAREQRLDEIAAAISQLQDLAARLAVPAVHGTSTIFP